jgi:sulfatase maturation enzyme AslB (radical SAM superfamily)
LKNDIISSLDTCSSNTLKKIVSAIEWKQEVLIAPPTKRYQSLSIDVPWMCPNRCKYCVSAMHTEELWEQIGGSKDYEKFEQKYLDAMAWVKEEWTDTLILTWGLSDPIVNDNFLRFIWKVNRKLWITGSFKKIEIQTSGILINDKKLDLLKEIWVKTIALSLSSLDDRDNIEISWIKKNLEFSIQDICKQIKEKWFNLRLCFNLSDHYHKFFKDGIESFMNKCQSLWANQLTFRQLYKSWDTPEIDNWIEKHQFDTEVMNEILKYVRKNGRIIWRLSFGQLLFSLNKKMSIVVDDDCMNSKSTGEVKKYSIIRPDWHLYSHWDDEGSLIF